MNLGKLEIMKKVSSLLLLLLILIANLGLSQGDHYCDGKIVSQFLIPHIPDECKDMTDDHSCENIIIDKWSADPFEQISFSLKFFDFGYNCHVEVDHHFDNYEEGLYSEDKLFRECEFPDIFLWNMSFLI